ncbi:MAG: hypothetical protein IT271_13805 [Chitinophagales bacterium]|nr:hypothetical protein [Chitinophagales bacterium]
MFLGIFTNTTDVFNNEFIFLNDFLFGGLFVLGSYLVVKNIAEKHYKGTVHYHYLMNAYKVKIVCTILFTLIFAFYYKGGDTFAYLCNVLQLKDLMTTNPEGLFYILFDSNSFEAHYHMDDYMLGEGSYMTDSSTKMVIFMAFFISFICFNSYVFLSLVCSMIALIGCWRLYRVFSELYPHLHKQMAIACLFLPSVCFWGAGLLKDPICIGALGVFTYAVYDLFIKRNSPVANTFLIIFMVYIVMNIKVYIILSYAPAVFMWIFSRYRYTIKSPFIKAVIGPLMMVLGVGVGVLVLTQMAKFAERYAFEEMMRTAKDTQNWLVTSSKMTGGSFYTLGDIDYTYMGLLKIAPKAVNVSLFRPYIWEAKKPMLIIAALEGMLTFFMTVRLIFKSGFFKFFKMISDNPEVQFCIIFSIIFAFAVGFTSFNFGALARYKIPFMPFYYIALFVLSDTQKKQESQLVKSN